MSGSSKASSLVIAIVLTIAVISIPLTFVLLLIYFPIPTLVLGSILVTYGIFSSIWSELRGPY